MHLTPDDYDAWSKRHAAMFGFSHANDGAVFAAWFEVFAASGYSAADLHGATDELAKRTDRIGWREDHLFAINAFVIGRRVAKRKADEPPPDEFGECTLCGNSGLVVVPHPKYVEGREWKGHWLGYRPTAAVTCSCWSGRRWLDGYDRRPAGYRDRIKRPLALEAYQKRVPGWKTMMDTREAAATAAARAETATRATDKAAGPLAGLVAKVFQNVPEGG
jgi:hypothetical protein